MTMRMIITMIRMMVFDDDYDEYSFYDRLVPNVLYFSIVWRLYILLTLKRLNLRKLKTVTCRNNTCIYC